MGSAETDRLEQAALKHRQDERTDPCLQEDGGRPPPSADECEAVQEVSPCEFPGTLITSHGLRTSVNWSRRYASVSTAERGRGHQKILST